MVTLLALSLIAVVALAIVVLYCLCEIDDLRHDLKIYNSDIKRELEHKLNRHHKVKGDGLYYPANTLDLANQIQKNRDILSEVVDHVYSKKDKKK